MSAKVLEAVCKRFASFVVDTHAQCGDETVVLRREGLVPVVEFLKTDPEMAFDMCIDVTAVDKLGFPEHTGPRFEVVYHFYSLRHRHRIRLKVPVEQDDPVVDTLSFLYKGANWFEREVWDMFGIRFRGSPDHRRMLLYEEFEGHPLRKDYPQRGYQPLIEMPTLPRPDDELPEVVDEDL